MLFGGRGQRRELGGGIPCGVAGERAVRRPAGVALRQELAERVGDAGELGDLVRHRLGRRGSGPHHVHPRQQRLAVALQLGDRAADLVEVVGRSHGEPVRAAGHPERRHPEDQGSSHAPNLERARPFVEW